MDTSNVNIEQTVLIFSNTAIPLLYSEECYEGQRQITVRVIPAAKAK